MKIHSAETRALAIIWGRCVGNLGCTRPPFRWTYRTVLDDMSDRWAIRFTAEAPDSGGAAPVATIEADWTPDIWPGTEPARDYALAMALFYFEHEACERMSLLREGRRPWHPHASQGEFTSLRGLWQFRTEGRGNQSVLSVLTLLMGDRRKAASYLGLHSTVAQKEYGTVLAAEQCLSVRKVETFEVEFPENGW